MLHRLPIVLASLASLSLTGCGSLLAPQQAPLTYRLSPDTANAVSPAAPDKTFPYSLQVAAPRSDAGFDTSSIAYRQHPYRLDYYTQSRWVDLPAAMLGERITHAIEQSGVVPDMITLAKSMAGGFPISAVTGRAEIMDAPAPGGLGGTYAGNPIACAAALATLDLFEQTGVIKANQELSATMRAAVAGRGDSALQVLAVTVMTSYDDADLAEKWREFSQIPAAAFGRSVADFMKRFSRDEVARTFRALLLDDGSAA